MAVRNVSRAVMASSQPWFSKKHMRLAGWSTKNNVKKRRDTTSNHVPVAIVYADELYVLPWYVQSLSRPFLIISAVCGYALAWTSHAGIMALNGGRVLPRVGIFSKNKSCWNALGIYEGVNSITNIAEGCLPQGFLRTLWERPTPQHVGCTCVAQQSHSPPRISQ